MKNPINEIKSLCVRKTFPDGEKYDSLGVRDVIKLERSLGMPGKEIEIAALENGVVPERYARNMKSFSFDDQIALLRAGAVITGLGGLGGTVAEILSRIGIGTLALIDGDVFEDSNLNRQAVSSQDGLGKSKAECAEKRVNSINSSVIVRRHDTRLNEKNGIDLIAGSDVAVDCLDNVKTRFELEKVSKLAGIPLVSAAVAGASGHVTVIFPEDPGLRLIYGESENREAPGAEATLGCLPFAVTAIAAAECSEAVKILLNRGELLRNKMLAVDFADNTMDVLDLM